MIYILLWRGPVQNGIYFSSAIIVTWDYTDCTFPHQTRLRRNPSNDGCSINQTSNTQDRWFLESVPQIYFFPRVWHSFFDPRMTSTRWLEHGRGPSIVHNRQLLFARSPKKQFSWKTPRRPAIFRTPRRHLEAACTTLLISVMYCPWITRGACIDILFWGVGTLNAINYRKWVFAWLGACWSWLIPRHLAEGDASTEESGVSLIM